jgi:hypothetical protein
MTESPQTPALPAPKQRRAWLALLPLVALTVLAIGLLVAPAFGPEPPTDTEWLAAAEFVQERFAPGDVIRLEPGWMTAGRAYFGDLDGGPRAPFRILDLHDPVDPAWLLRYQRLWQVTALGAQDEWQNLVPPELELVEETVMAGVTVRLFAIPQGRVRWQMLAALPFATVTRQGDTGPVVCKWQGKSHRCKLKGAMDVDQQLRRVAGSARQCVNVNTGPELRPVTLSFPGVSGPGTLLVRIANTIEAARAKDGGNVTAVVFLDGAEIGQIHLDRRLYTLEEVVFELTDNTEKELVIQLQATDDRKREICLDGYVIGNPDPR